MLYMSFTYYFYLNTGELNIEHSYLKILKTRLPINEYIITFMMKRKLIFKKSVLHVNVLLKYRTLYIYRYALPQFIHTN